MNSLILYWNSVWKAAMRDPALVGSPHTVQEYAAFNRSLRRKTPFEWRNRLGGKSMARKALRLVTSR